MYAAIFEINGQMEVDNLRFHTAIGAGFRACLLCERKNVQIPVGVLDLDKEELVPPPIEWVHCNSRVNHNFPVF